MCALVLLLLLMAAAATVGQRSDVAQTDNTGSWGDDVACVGESCLEYWRNVGLSYAEYYANLFAHNLRRGGSNRNRDRPRDRSDSSSSSSSSSEESGRRKRRSVDSEEENYSDDSDIYVDDYNRGDNNEKAGEQPHDRHSSNSLKTSNIGDGKNQRHIRSQRGHKRVLNELIRDDIENWKENSYKRINPDFQEIGHGMGRHLQRPFSWRTRKYPLWMRRRVNCTTETPRKIDIFERTKAPTRKPCTKYSPWLPLCTREKTTQSTKGLPSTITATPEPTINERSTSTPTGDQSTQSPSAPAEEQSSAPTNGPAKEMSTTEFLFTPVIT